MIGLRDTLVFYIFEKEKAALRLHISNKDATFPTTATLYIFAEDVTADGLGKWLNNQHSDGLFPEVPEPTMTKNLPDGEIKILGKEVVGEEKHHHTNETYQDFKVKFSVKEQVEKGKYKLDAFEDSTGVFVKATDS